MRKSITLADARYRIIGLSVFIAGVILLTVLKYLNYQYEDSWETWIFVINHYVIIFSLVMLTYSREKKDDERVQRIRYVVLKISYVWTIIGISVYMVITTLDRFQFNAFVILYIVEAVLIIYQILFRSFLVANPKWIFTESSGSTRSFLLLLICLVFLIAWIIFVVISFKIPQ